MTASRLEANLAFRIAAAGIPPAQREYRFAAVAVGLGPGLRARLSAAGLQDWRFDFAWPSARVAIEVDGAVWTAGRHTRGGGYESDARKGNAAIDMGWSVYHVTSSMLRTGEASRLLDTIRGRIGQHADASDNG